MNGEGSNNVRKNGAPVGIQAILETGRCLGFSDVWRQSFPRSGRTCCHSRFPPGKMKAWLTDLEVVPSEVTCSKRFIELLHRQVQVTVEQLVHYDEINKRLLAPQPHLLTILRYERRPLTNAFGLILLSLIKAFLVFFRWANRCRSWLMQPKPCWTQNPCRYSRWNIGRHKRMPSRTSRAPAKPSTGALTN